MMQHHAIVSRKDRQALLQQSGFILWFTGLPGAGKSTLAHHIERHLFEYRYHTFLFDGDNIRRGLCSDMGFSEADRHENIRRIGEVSRLFLDAGIIGLAAFISPFCRDREIIRGLLPDGDFIEIYCNASLDICEARDPKGLYKKARIGKIKDFTGIGSPYEKPEHPEITVATGNEDVQSCSQQVIDYLVAKNRIILPG